MSTLLIQVLLASALGCFAGFALAAIFLVAVIPREPVGSVAILFVVCSGIIGASIGAIAGALAP